MGRTKRQRVRKGLKMGCLSQATKQYRLDCSATTCPSQLCQERQDVSSNEGVVRRNDESFIDLMKWAKQWGFNMKQLKIKPAEFPGLFCNLWFNSIQYILFIISIHST